MRKSIIVYALLCLCVCLMACGEQQPQPPPSPDSPGNESVTEGAIAINEPAGGEQNIAKQKLLLRVSDIPYSLPLGGELNSGGVNEDLLVYDYSEADNIIIFDQILGEQIVDEYVNDILSNMDSQELMNAPNLYHMIRDFNVSLETLLEFNANNPNRVRQYDENILRAMYLPYEEMINTVLTPKGAYLNGNVYNIQTLNQLFQEDKEAFAKIKLSELVDYQERLEGKLIGYGFNQDMVDFANQNCVQ